MKGFWISSIAMLFTVSIVSSAYSLEISNECLNAYKYGVLDTIKTFSDQRVIRIEKAPYWLIENVSTLGRGQVILKMASAERNLLTPVLIWFNGGKYIVYAFDNDPYHLKELKETAGLEKAFVIKSEKMKGFRRIYIDIAKECNYPIYTLKTLVYALKKKIEEDIRNPRKRERLLELVKQIELELTPTTEEEIWQLIDMNDR